MGKTRVIAETGAGQHGVATAAACAKLGLYLSHSYGASAPAEVRPERTEAEDAASLKEELLGQVVAATTFDKLDEKKLEDYYGNLVNYYTALASNRGVSLETYISAYYGKSSNEFYAELKSIAEKTMKEELVLNEIISKEKIELTDASYSEKITEYMDRYGYTDQAKFEQDYTVEKIRQSMLFDLAIQKIIDYAVAE